MERIKAKTSEWLNKVVDKLGSVGLRVAKGKRER